MVIEVEEIKTCHNGLVVKTLARKVCDSWFVHGSAKF